MTPATRNNEYIEIASQLASHGKVRTDVPMSGYTSFKTGGNADILVEPATVDQVEAITGIAGREGVPLTVIGGGSNLLVGDGGIRGIVMRIALDGEDDGHISAGEDGTVRAHAGVKKSTFIQYCSKNGLSGIEFMAGIPGCLGGGIIMNAGTNMGCFADILERVTCFVPGKGPVEEEINHSRAGYRSMGLPDGVIVLEALYALERTGDAAAIKRSVEDNIRDRNAKHPVQYPSAGSVFKNPEGRSSWKLVNDAGLKGKTMGGAMVSDLHTNFIINTGNATSADIRGMIELVQETVEKQYGILLHPEVRMVGEFI